MYDWCRNIITIENDIEKLGMSKSTTVAWNQHMRVVPAEIIASNRVKIGNESFTVELDETLFAKSKYDFGRLYPQQWVFGGICQETRPIFTIPVLNRYSATLMALVRTHVRSGTTIMMDHRRCYSGLSSDGFTRLSMLRYYLTEAVWRRRCAGRKQWFELLLQDFATLYPPSCPLHMLTAALSSTSDSELQQFVV
uniref:ISXO2-like transposase domain-containing protein n=1 Tax=Trichuris muris TaxID=70415 RepID=A0A5S6QYP5_TRIMR